MMIGSTSAGSADLSAAPRVPQLDRSPRSPMPRRMHSKCTTIDSASAISRPGTIVATNSAPTETLASAPKMMSPRLGGIMLARIDAALVSATPNGLG